MRSGAIDIDFDDLTSPQLTDIQRQILEYTEARPVDFDIDQMLAEAIERAGVGADFDDNHGFSERLAAHVAAIDADHDLTQLTRTTLRQRVVRLLRNRLSLTDLLKRYPEIESIDIEQPFIVVGMPRSGTTHLVNLIASDPRRRALPYWESQEPIPAAGDGPDIFGVDPRYARAKAEHDALMASAPVVAAMHDRFPEAIEEEVRDPAAAEVIRRQADVVDDDERRQRMRGTRLEVRRRQPARGGDPALRIHLERKRRCAHRSARSWPAGRAAQARACSSQQNDCGPMFTDSLRGACTPHSAQRTIGSGSAPGPFGRLAAPAPFDARHVP